MLKESQELFCEIKHSLNSKNWISAAQPQKVMDKIPNSVDTDNNMI